MKFKIEQFSFNFKEWIASTESLIKAETQFLIILVSANSINLKSGGLSELSRSFWSDL